MNIKEYWRAIKQSAQELDPEAAQADARESDAEDKVHLKNSTKEIWITSVDNPSKGSVGGQTVTARPMNAAELMFNGTHRRSTDPEIEAEKARREAKALEIESDEVRRKTQVELNQQIAMPPELSKMIELQMQMLQMQQQQHKPADPKPDSKAVDKPDAKKHAEMSELVSSSRK